MRAFAPYLDALGGQSRVMADLVAQWVEIRSSSYEIEGLSRMAEALKVAFGALGGEMEELTLPPQRIIDSNGHPKDVALGKALRFRKRPGAPATSQAAAMAAQFGGLPDPTSYPEPPLA